MTSVKEAPAVVLSETNMKPMFATPLINYRWPESDDLNNSLRTLILEREAEDPGIVASNMNAWHSRNDFLKQNNPCILELKERIGALMTQVVRTTAVKAYGNVAMAVRADGWATVIRNGGYHVVHNHPGHMWSGVYYVATGDERPAGGTDGAIVFVDPRMGANMIPTPGDPFGQRCQISPRPGLMIMFPAWLGHFVHPFTGVGERITVSFNIDFKLKDEPSAD